MYGVFIDYDGTLSIYIYPLSRSLIHDNDIVIIEKLDVVRATELPDYRTVFAVDCNHALAVCSKGLHEAISGNPPPVRGSNPERTHKHKNYSDVDEDLGREARFEPCAKRYQFISYSVFEIHGTFNILSILYYPQTTAMS